MSEKYTPEQLFARPWLNHSATTVGFVADDGQFIPLADCSIGPHASSDYEPFANLVAAAPELLAELKKTVENAEQSAFEIWLVQARPSGAVEEVQDQWERSSDFDDFCAEWETQRAAIAKAAGGAA